MTYLLSQAGTLRNAGSDWSILGIIIAVIIVIAVASVLHAYVVWMEWKISPFFVKVFWIVVGTFVAIMAVKLIWSMW